MPNELSEIALHLAGETGQVGLVRTAGTVGAQACLDQHAAEVRDALTGHPGARPAGRLTRAMLLEYAQGFVEAAIGRGWWPPHRGESASAGPAILDWESLRLTAVCRLLGESALS